MYHVRTKRVWRNLVAATVLEAVALVACRFESDHSHQSKTLQRGNRNNVVGRSGNCNPSSICKGSTRVLLKKCSEVVNQLLDAPIEGTPMTKPKISPPPGRKRGPKPSLKVCPFCGNGYFGRTKKFCSMECFLNHRKAQKHSVISMWWDATADTPFDTSIYDLRHLRAFLIDKYGACWQCGWDKRNPKTRLLPLELEHKDGDCENNRKSNLELLCPNCHSLTPTYRSLNWGNSKRTGRVA